MCSSMFKTPKAPEAPKVMPAPDPAPTPTAEEPAVQSTEDTRKSRLKKMRSGLASTIKTKPSGLVGSLYDSGSSAGKSMLGA